MLSYSLSILVLVVLLGAAHSKRSAVRPRDDPQACPWDVKICVDEKLLTKRKMIARLLIENACSLPYDCPTELLLPELPVKLMDPPQKLNPDPTPGDTDKHKVHYVQALWDPDVISFTEDSLQELLSQFGVITNLAINETGNSALAAFVTAESAQSAVAADLPNVKIRERRQHRALNQTQPGLSFASSLDPTPLAEFVAFLETRASSQIKILEAEIRAGQELLRLHKSQHEKELRALESEITGLRLARTQAEKMCAELRDDLRKCRNELGCHLATAAAIKSDKRELEEQLVLCENQLRTKEQELFKLQLSHEELREAAASAQMRIEKYRQTGKIEMVESAAQSKALHASNQPLFPKTTAFLSEHSSKNERNVEPTVPQSLNRGNMILYDNSRELQSMREKLQEHIQAQIESTRAALQDIQVFDVSSPSLVDDETELTRMQQQLTSARAELEDSMESSRDKLAQIMNPTRSPHTRSHLLEETEVPRALIQQLLSKARFDNQELDNFDNSSHSESCVDSDFMIPPGIQHMNLGAAARNQSQLYSAWQARRTQTKVTQPSGASQTSNASLLQAQQSLQAFNKTLATVRKQPPPRPTANASRA
ncbi:hypothetical protein Poli38472_002589 [Pythium oligandrum]|uniref:RRM domain-containing protein n=1 Tax=Pythium oligandrum TaxID=41045 RepID=A0A8K1CIM5_PYTOL|nr:hypothetical protein Poli38472_002589 [Pythium oligandrum]|eukprot:TMW63648.1 hypothetical protein Poli38472_002589 [Pythium oligandrum]